MKAEYKRDLYNNYMVFRDIVETEETTYTLQMLLNNSISGFLKMEQRIIDNEKQYYYDITAKQPLLLLFQKGQLNKEQILRIMKGILTAIEKAREYLLKENDFILSPEYIYMNLSGGKIELCYRPGYGQDINGQLREVISFLMDKVDYKEQEAVLFSYGLYKISREADCTINKLWDVLEGKYEPYGEFKEEIEREQKQREELEERKNRELFGTQGLPLEEKPYTEEMEVEEEIKKYKASAWILGAVTVVMALGIMLAFVKTGVLINRADGTIEYMRALGVLGIVGVTEAGALSWLFDEKKKVPVIKTKKVYIDAANGCLKAENTFVEQENRWNGNERDVQVSMTDRLQAEEKEEQEQTMLLGKINRSENYKLGAVESSRYEDISLIEFPFFIGKLKTKVDYAIKSDAVSRFHAKLEQEGDFFYLVDLNSTNGTYLNGTRISCNEKNLIHIGDEIAFADVKYQFIKV